MRRSGDTQLDVQSEFGNIFNYDNDLTVPITVAGNYIFPHACSKPYYNEIQLHTIEILEGQSHKSVEYVMYR